MFKILYIIGNMINISSLPVAFFTPLQIQALVLLTIGTPLWLWAISRLKEEEKKKIENE